VKLNQFYQIDKNELIALLDFYDIENKQTPKKFLENLIKDLNDKRSVFYFKNNEIIYIGDEQFLLKKENTTKIKIVLIGKFLTINTLIEIGIVSLEVEKIKKRYYFRVVPSKFLKVLNNDNIVIIPNIYEVIELTKFQTKTILALLE
jgi:hypothetical protein